MKNSTFKNLFENRDVIIKAFNENSFWVDAFNWSYKQNSMSYSCIGKGTQRKENIKVNKILNNLGFRLYKNTIILNSKLDLNDIELSYQFIKYFKSFFIPVWIETKNGYTPISQDKLPTIIYKSIEKQNNILIVDGYSSDLFVTMNANILKYLFLQGKQEDIVFANTILTPKTEEKVVELEYHIRLQQLKETLKTQGIKNIPAKDELRQSILNYNGSFRKKTWSYVMNDIWEKYLGVYLEKNQMLSDEGKLFDLNCLQSSFCELVAVKSNKKEDVHIVNKVYKISEIEIFYVKDYYLEVSKRDGTSDKYKITSYFEKIGLLSCDRKIYKNLFQVDNDNKMLQDFPKGVFPKDLYYPIKHYINGFFFRNAYFKPDFRVETNVNIIT